MSNVQHHETVRKLSTGFLDIKPTTAQESPLTDLPAEIRLMIWEYALSGNTISPTVWHSDTSPKPKLFLQMARCITGIRPPSNRFALLRVCHQTYAEAAALPYLLSTFRFYNARDLMFWLERTPTHFLAMLRFVEFGCMKHVKPIELGRWKKFMQQLPGLKEFHIKACLASFVPERYIMPRWHLWTDDDTIKLAKKGFNAYGNVLGPRGQVELTYEILRKHTSWEEVVKGLPNKGSRRQQAI